MYFAIVTKLADGAGEARSAATPAHRRYLEAHAASLLAAGPTFAEDGTTPVGSVYIIDAADRREAERFVADDPMTASGARALVEIAEWRMAGFDRRYPLPAPEVARRRGERGS